MQVCVCVCVCPTVSYGTQKKKAFPCWESKPDPLVIHLMAEWLYWAVLVPLQWLYLKGGAAFIHYLYLCSSQAAPERSWNCRFSYGCHGKTWILGQLSTVHSPHRNSPKIMFMPTHLPNLSACDLFLQGCLRRRVFQTHLADLHNLKLRISKEINVIPPTMYV
jgi:hypothetical protein